MASEGSAAEVRRFRSGGQSLEPDDPGQARRPSRRQDNLPEQLTSFIGRAQDRSRVRELLGEARLLTLVGAGGCGKTRLALQCAGDLVDRFSEGAWLVELAALDDGGLLADTVVSALGCRGAPDQAAIDILLQQLRRGRSLLLLDNCEHLLGPCATLVDVLLRSCPGLVVLATSREALRVPGETAYRVPSLDVPPRSGSPEEVAASDAVRLFVDRAAQARPGFQVTEGNAGAVATICRVLDGIPLAIELAAARMGVLAPEQMVGTMEDRFRLLSRSSRTAAPRHQTLRASLDWSHDLCSEPERMLLRRLSVWTGGWTLEGAEAVSADEDLDGDSVLDLLSALVDRSLVETEARTAEIRYGMLETVRAYAGERLAQSGESEITQARHLAWCLELAERAEPELLGHDAGSWLGRLDAEAANLRVALDHAVATDVGAALRLAAALTFFWLTRGRLDEGTTALARSLERAAEPSAARGKALWGLAYLNIYQGQFQDCLDHAGRALADGEAVRDPGVMARALGAQGLIVCLADPVHARGPLERGLALAHEADDQWCVADATRMLGGMYMRQSEHDLARPLLQDGHALARRLGYRSHQAWYLGLLATGDLEHGRLGVARELAEQATAVADEIGEAVPLLYAVSLLVECDVLEGRPGAGRARADPHIQRMHGTGVNSAAVWLEGALALADVAEGDADGARARCEAMIPHLAAGPSYDNVTRVRRGLAFALLVSADPGGAALEAARLLSHAEAGRNEHVEALGRYLLGRVALADGRLGEAGGHLHGALAIAAGRDFRLLTLNSLETLAALAGQTNNPSEAARLLGAVHADRGRLGVVRWPPEAELWAGVEEKLRHTLGDDGFGAAWGEGLALSTDEAVRYASRSRGRRNRPSTGWESLTPTELELVRHVAGGLSNPQIAERMFVSRATVKAHLSHIFAKLGISSRSELAAEAARRDLAGGAAGTTVET